MKGLGANAQERVHQLQSETRRMGLGPVGALPEGRRGEVLIDREQFEAARALHRQMDDVRIGQR